MIHIFCNCKSEKQVRSFNFVVIHKLFDRIFVPLPLVRNFTTARFNVASSIIDI